MTKKTKITLSLIAVTAMVAIIGGYCVCKKIEEFDESFDIGGADLEFDDDFDIYEKNKK